MNELQEKTVELGQLIKTQQAMLIDILDALVRYEEFLNDQLRDLE